MRLTELPEMIYGPQRCTCPANGGLCPAYGVCMATDGEPCAPPTEEKHL